MTYQEAVSHFKTKYQMAKALGLTRQAVQHWSKNLDKPIPELRAYQIKDILAKQEADRLRDELRSAEHKSLYFELRNGRRHYRRHHHH